MYWTDLFERYVENGRQNVCGHYSQKVPLYIFTNITRIMVCMLVGGQNVGLGSQPTTPKKTDSSSCSDQTSPPLPIVHSPSHCIVDLQFVFLHLGIYVRMCLHFFQIKPILSLSPYLLFLDGQRYCEKYSVLITI